MSADIKIVIAIMVFVAFISFKLGYGEGYWDCYDLFEVDLTMFNEQHQENFTDQFEYILENNRIPEHVEEDKLK